MSASDVKCSRENWVIKGNGLEWKGKGTPCCCYSIHLIVCLPSFCAFDVDQIYLCCDLSMRRGRTTKKDPCFRIGFDKSPGIMGQLCSSFGKPQPRRDRDRSGCAWYLILPCLVAIYRLIIAVTGGRGGWLNFRANKWVFFVFGLVGLGRAKSKRAAVSLIILLNEDFPKSKRGRLYVLWLVSPFIK